MVIRTAETEKCSASIDARFFGLENTVVSCSSRGQGHCLKDVLGDRPQAKIVSGECRADVDQAQAAEAQSLAVSSPTPQE